MNVHLGIGQLNVLNALLAVIVAVVAATVGLYKAKQISHEHLDQALEDYRLANDAKDQRINQMQQQIDNQSRQVLELTDRVGEIRGHNDALLRQHYLIEQYCEDLIRLLQKHHIAVPMRPKAEDL